MRVRRLSVALVLAVGVTLAPGHVFAYHSADAARSQLRPALAVRAQRTCDRTAPADVRSAVRLFVAGAVERADLGSSYGVAFSTIRGTQTCHEWLSGTIAVVPFQPIDWARSGIALSYCRDARLVFVVDLVAEDGQLPETLFLLGVRRLRKGVWAVDYWLPGPFQATVAGPLVSLDRFVGAEQGTPSCGSGSASGSGSSSVSGAR